MWRWFLLFSIFTSDNHEISNWPPLAMCFIWGSYHNLNKRAKQLLIEITCEHNNNILVDLSWISCHRSGKLKKATFKITIQIKCSNDIIYTPLSSIATCAKLFRSTLPSIRWCLDQHKPTNVFFKLKVNISGKMCISYMN